MELVAVLHNIRSVHNVGSIFRTADGAGLAKIYLTGVTPAPLDRFGKVRPDFAKVALGAEAGLPWEKKTSISRLISDLREDGYKIFAVEQAPGSADPFRPGFNKTKKAALIMGAEVRGLPSSILKKADKILEIPMRGRKESLNVAVAFGITAYALAGPRGVG